MTNPKVDDRPDARAAHATAAAALPSCTLTGERARPAPYTVTPRRRPTRHRSPRPDPPHKRRPTATTGVTCSNGTHGDFAEETGVRFKSKSQHSVV